MTTDRPTIPDVPKAPFDRIFEKMLSPSCISPPVIANPDMPVNGEGLDASNFIQFFDQYQLPFPVTVSFNPNETEPCRTIGDVLRKYFSLGYRYGALDLFLGQCCVTQINENQFVLSKTGEQFPANPFQPLHDHVLSETANNDRPEEK